MYTVIIKVNIGNYVSEKFEGSPPLTPRCFAALNAAVVVGFIPDSTLLSDGFLYYHKY